MPYEEHETFEGFGTVERIRALQINYSSNIFVTRRYMTTDS